MYPISVISDEFKVGNSVEEFERICRVLHSMDIDYLDLRKIFGKLPVELTDNDIHQIKKTCEQYKIKIGCINSNLFKGSMSGLLEKEQVEKYKETVLEYCRICNEFGTKYLRVFPFRSPLKYKDSDPIPNEIIQFYLELSDIAKPFGVILCSENENNLYGNSPKHMIEFVERIDRPNVRLLFDPGNIFRFKPNFPVDRMDELYKYSAYSHLKDVAKNIFGFRYHVPVGDGFIGFKDMLRKMKNEGYNSLFAIETHMAKNKYNNTIRSLENLKNIMKELEWNI